MENNYYYFWTTLAQFSYYVGSQLDFKYMILSLVTQEQFQLFQDYIITKLNIVQKLKYIFLVLYVCIYRLPSNDFYCVEI